MTLSAVILQDGQKLKLRKLEKLFLSRLSTLHGPDVAKHWQDKGLLQSKVCSAPVIPMHVVMQVLVLSPNALTQQHLLTHLALPQLSSL